MARDLVAKGHINVETLDEAAIQALGGDLEDVLIGVREISVRLEGGLLHFSARGEICAGDDLPWKLQWLAEQHGVTFMAYINETGDVCEVHFFGANAEAVQALMAEYKGRAWTDTFPSVGSE